MSDCEKCAPDDPCFCGHPIKENLAKVRYSARFVERYRELSGNRRFPLSVVKREEVTE